MNRYGLMALLLSASAAAQATHHGYIWVEGPDEALAPNTTYTLEVWGGVESPLFVHGTSMMAGFGIDILNTGGGDSVASVSNVRIAEWARAFGTTGSIQGNDIIGVSGGQMPQDFPMDPPELRNPIELFSFDLTTAGGPLGQISFAPANPHPFGGLSFYTHWWSGLMLIIPNQEGSELHFGGWTSTVPSPGSGLTLVLACISFRRSRSPNFEQGVKA